jgi:hypothetical protein
MIGEIDQKKYDVAEQDGVRVIAAKFWNDCEHQLGTYMEDTDYDFVVEEDTDFYAPPKCDVEKSITCDQHCNNCANEDDIIFKLRKGAFSEAEQNGAYEGLLAAALPTQNRGVAAGPKGAQQGQRDWVTNEQVDIMEHYIEPKATLMVDEDPIVAIKQKHAGDVEGQTRGMVWLRSKIQDSGYTYEGFFRDKMEEWADMTPEEASKNAKQVKTEFISDTSYANQVLSGLAGFFDRYPRIPYGRATSYTEHNMEMYEKCYPFMRQLASKFAELLPRRHGVQVGCANKIDPRFRVAGEDTPFTTITVNKNFRTAAHRDAGDLHEGFSNLTVVAKDKQWDGGYLVLPEFRVAINIRPGDLLLINNHGGIHGNTELRPPEGKTIADMERISLVCYFREKMLELGSWDYEAMRRQFVDDRRLNEEHPMWRKLWNGVSSGMWESEEWYDYLRNNGCTEMLTKYHPKSSEIPASIEEFF